MTTEIKRAVKMKYKLNRFSFVIATFVAAVGCATMDAGKGDLMDAARTGNAEKVKALIAAGADVNAKGEAGETALMGAASEGNAEAVKALLAAGADINAKNNNGETALMISEKSGHTDIIQLLKQAEAN